MIQVKDFFFRNAQALILIVAILIWVWANYLHDKVFPDTTSPRAEARAEVSHVIFSTCLDSEHRLIRAKVEVRNVGPVEVKLSVNDHSIAQVSPSPAGKKFGDMARVVGPTGSKPGLIVWPKLEAVEDEINKELRSTESTDKTLQPNEIHEQYHDFVIPPSLKVIEVTSTIKDTSLNEGKEIVNWEGEVKTIYDVGDPTCPNLVASEATDAK